MLSVLLIIMLWIMKDIPLWLQIIGTVACGLNLIYQLAKIDE